MIILVVIVVIFVVVFNYSKNNRMGDTNYSLYTDDSNFQIERMRKIDKLPNGEQEMTTYMQVTPSVHFSWPLSQKVE